MDCEIGHYIIGLEQFVDAQEYDSCRERFSWQQASQNGSQYPLLRPEEYVVHCFAGAYQIKERGKFVNTLHHHDADLQWKSVKPIGLISRYHQHI